MSRDITRPVVIRAVARDTLSGRLAQAVGCEGGGRVPGGYPVTKTMDTEDGRDCRAWLMEMAEKPTYCCGVDGPLGRAGRGATGGKVGSKRQVESASRISWLMSILNLGLFT